LTDGNPNITDLNDQNRPGNVADQFSEVYDNEWTNAFEVLQTMGFTEKKAIVQLRKLVKVRHLNLNWL